MAGKKHVIIGGGTAGFNAIRTLRQSGNTDDVALVSAEKPYSRMVLPYFLERGISEAHVYTATLDQLEAWGVQTHFGRRAAALDTGANTLTLDNDDTLTYDSLLIATGSSAQRPPIDGADGAGVYSFWTLADAKGLDALLTPKSHVVMVGAGFIAFTILSGVLSRAGKVTVVEVEPRILPRMVDDAAAAMVAQRLEASGVDLRTGTRLERIAHGSGGKKTLHLAGGERIQADIVVMATGIRPNLEWLEGAGLAMESGGIVVDDHCRSSVPNIYAAGDVAAGANRITGAREVHAIEPTAQEHGRVAGANMGGGNVAYPGSLMINIVGVGGLDIASFGAWDDARAEAIVASQPQRSAYRKYLFRGDVLTGAIYVGPSSATWASNDLGMTKGLVHSGQALGPWKEHLANHPFDIKKPFLATGTVGKLIPANILGKASPSPSA